MNQLPVPFVEDWRNEEKEKPCHLNVILIRKVTRAAN